MKVTFWLLDINPRFEEGKDVELWLWGIDAEGNRVLIIDKNFIAYFYALVKEGFDPSKIGNEIMERCASSVVKTEVLDRRFFGKPLKAIKVSCKVATDTGKVAKQLRTLEGIKECLEDDIRVPMRYLIDNNVVPCTWHELEAMPEEKSPNVRVGKVYVAKSTPQHVTKSIDPKLRTLSVSMINYSREGSPKPDRNPVLIISTTTNNSEKKQFVSGDDKNDQAVIENFVEYVRTFDPDVILSFGGNSLDWDYLEKRSHKLQRTFDIDRSLKEPHTSIYGHVSFSGMANVDLADFMAAFPEVKVQTLSNLASYIGVTQRQPNIEIETVEFADYWDDLQNRELLKQYSQKNACNIQSCAVLLLDFAMQLASLVSLPLDHVMTAAVGFRVEWFLIKQTHEIGELIPQRIEQPYRPYTGGLVLRPKPGLHDDIAVLDFKSMYPNIMIRYNLSPDTYIAPQEPEPPGGVYEAPEVKHRFRKEPPGFYKESLTFLISVRGIVRTQMKTFDQSSVEYNLLDARQKAVKIITNAVYGYAGWIGARWYVKPVAEAASAWGRYTILSATHLAENKGLSVIYGDTDSLFLTNNQKKLQELQLEIKEDSGLDVEVSEQYKRIFFTEAKKRYAGLKTDNTLDIVGLEVIRGDWAGVAKTVQQNVLEIILKDKSPQEAVTYVHSVIKDLRQRKIPMRDLIIWKNLTKPPEQYAIKAPHVEAAKMLKEKGWKLAAGDKVGFVVLSGKGRLYGRVIPYVFFKYDQIDIDYYINNQVVPAAARILGFFGVKEAELLRTKLNEKENIRSLLDYI